MDNQLDLQQKSDNVKVPPKKKQTKPHVAKPKAKPKAIHAVALNHNKTRTHVVHKNLTHSVNKTHSVKTNTTIKSNKSTNLTHNKTVNHTNHVN